MDDKFVGEEFEIEPNTIPLDNHAANNKVNHVTVMAVPDEPLVEK